MPFGRIFTLALDATSSSATTLYVTGINGVYKSINGGGTWNRAGIPQHGVAAIVVDPMHPAILYTAGGGAASRSLDGGTTWSDLSDGLRSSVIRLAIEPAVPTTIYAAVPSRGVYVIQPSLNLACVGDCDQNGRVTIEELVAGVNQALGRSGHSACVVLDTNSSGTVTVDELVSAVNDALRGCPLSVP